jgi:serine protease Do
LEKNANGEGVTITTVESGSSADEKGLKAGDTILQLNGKEVSSVDDVRQELSAATTGGQKKILMLVRSGDRQRFVAMTVDKPKS